MAIITESMTLDHVEHIEASGSGTLDFAVAGEDQSYTWFGIEGSEWTVEDVVVELLREPGSEIPGFVRPVLADGLFLEFGELSHGTQLFSQLPGPDDVIVIDDRMGPSCRIMK